MADHAIDGDFDGDVFIYRGGRQIPQHVTHVLIDESVDEIEDDAFYECRRLVQVDTHDGLRKVGKWAFYCCRSLRRINLKFVVEIELYAFLHCENLESAEFGDRLETIGDNAFCDCYSLKHLKLPSIITIGKAAFGSCRSLTDAVLSERLETMEESAFNGCDRLQRIAIPLKRDLFEFSASWQKYSQFDGCEQLFTVDLVGQAHTKTIASLHMACWRTEMIAETNRINLVLPTAPIYGKTEEIQQWMESLLDKMDHYKAEHHRYVKEGTALLELALWKAKLGGKEESSVEGSRKKAKIDTENSRKGKRITCGANFVIKNVIPFLQLE